MRYTGVIFDLDGTLVDSIEDLAAAMNYGLGRLDLPTHTAEAYRHMVGDGVRRFAERALGPEQTGHTDRLLETMTAYYLDHCLVHSRPYAGMPAAVQQLGEKGLKLAVLTNKNHPPTIKIVEHFFGAGTFDPVIGMADGRRRKPDPASALEILEAWGLRAEEVLFVGDSDIDIHTARAAGMDVAAVSWGYRSRDTLSQAGPNVIVDQPSELLNLFND